MNIYKLKQIGYGLFKLLKFRGEYKSVFPVLIATSDDNLVIEILGPSGVGKSTLIKELSKTKYFRKAFIKVSDQYYNSEDFENWEVEFVKAVAKTISSTYLLTKSFKLLRRKLLLDREISKRSGIFIIDEGIAYGFNDVYFNLPLVVQKEMYKRFKQKLVINLTTKNPERIINQIHKRSKKGRTHPGHINKSDKELLHQIVSSLNRNNEKVKILKSLGCKELTLDIDDTIQFNVKKITDHIFKDRH